MIEIPGKTPPQSLEAEQNVLGALLIDKDALETAAGKLKGEYFYFDANREIFEAAKIIAAKNNPVDILTVSEELKKRKTFEMTGGMEYLTSLSENIVSTKNAEAYCGIIEEKAMIRELINASNEIIAKCYEQKEDPRPLLEMAESKIFSIAQERQSRDFSHLREIIHDVFDMLEERSKTEGSLTGITSGFDDIDNMTSGFQKSDLILLAARPSMGKTALALNIAFNAAVKGKAKVAIFSLEMSKEQLVQRILSMKSKVDSSNLRSGKLNEDDWERIANASNIISNADIYIDDTPGITLFELTSKCKRLKTRKGLDMIIIDYLQLMEGENNSESRQQQISTLSRGLKGLARELNCPVLSLSQLSRAPEQRTGNHRPILSDLRESGAIEQDADIVMFIFREYVYSSRENDGADDTSKTKAEIILAKHRNGPTGTVELVWKEEYTSFENASHRTY